MKRLQVPYNLEPYCLDMYAGWVDYIQDIYFAASPEIFPSARVWDYKDNYLDMQFQILDFCKKYDVRGAVLLNGVNNKLTDDNLDRLKGYLQMLCAHGLKVVVISNPVLSYWIRNNFPNLSIRLSILSLEYTLPKIISLYRTGLIDEICLPPELNRNEDSLKELKKQCPKLQLSTIVNSICRQSCPLYFWHQALYNSDRQMSDDKNMKQILTSVDNIGQNLSNSFKQIAFILPEEFDYYDQYFDGYKLEGRTWSTIALEQRLEYAALRINPTYLNDYLTMAWCCPVPQNYLTSDLDKDWLKYRRNCKTTCWRCKYELYCYGERIH